MFINWRWTGEKHSITKRMGPLWSEPNWMGLLLTNRRVRVHYGFVPEWWAEVCCITNFLVGGIAVNCRKESNPGKTMSLSILLWVFCARNSITSSSQGFNEIAQKMEMIRAQSELIL